jgi:hypothetical protein
MSEALAPIRALATEWEAAGSALYHSVGDRRKASSAGRRRLVEAALLRAKAAELRALLAKIEERDAAIRDEAKGEAQALRTAIAEVVRDHNMPPNKDQHGYDYRMGWWDAIAHADRHIRKRVRALLDGGDQS